MTRKAITLQNGQTVEGEIVNAAEADFIKMTWTFDIEADTRVGAGEYLLVSCVDLQIAAVEASSGKGETK